MYKSRINNAKRRSNREEKKRDIVHPDEGQEYGIVQEMLGNGRTRVLCHDKSIKIGRICGSMRKFKSKVLIESGDLVIVSAREFEKDKVDIIHKYGFDEAHDIAYNGYLPEYLYRVYTNPECFNYSITEDTTGDYVMFSHQTKNEEDEEYIDINDI
uniref:S1-like domain-containing protein n=1 Tax=viral metagenome TaxID=1070528 RepID=A0A6C0CU88_9ZZZZ